MSTGRTLQLGNLRLFLARRDIPALLRSITWLLAFSVLLLEPRITQAQPTEPSVKVQVRSNPVYAGTPADLVIIVEGSRDVSPPPELTIPGVDITYRGSQDQTQSSMSIINGRMSTHTTVIHNLSYSIVAAKPGTITIPALVLVVDGKTITTQPLDIDVIEPKVSSDVTIECLPETSTAYIGQPVRLKIVLSITRSLRAARVIPPRIEGAELLPGPDPRPPGTRQDDPNFAGIAFGNEAMYGVHESSVTANRRLDRFTFERVLIPRQPGTLSIDPLRLDFEAVVGTRARGLFDTPWDDVSVTERQLAMSKPITLTVKELPAQGRPVDFSGLVGSYGLRAELSPTSAAAGDPLNLSVFVSGPFPLTLVPPFDFTRQSLNTKEFRIPRDPVLSEINGSVAAFNTQIRARSDSVKQFPPLEINFFDPVSGTYKSARTPAIPLTITPNTTVALPSDIDGALPHIGAVMQESGSALPAGLLSSNPAPLRAVPAIMALNHRELLAMNTWRALLIAGPFLMLLALAVCLVRSLIRRDPASQRRSAAWRAFNRQVRHISQDPRRPDSAHSLAQAIVTYIAHRAQLRPNSTTSHEAIAFLSAHGNLPLSGDLKDIVQRCDRARFSTESQDIEVTDLTHRARAAIRNLHLNWRQTT